MGQGLIPAIGPCRFKAILVIRTTRCASFRAAHPTQPTAWAVQEGLDGSPRGIPKTSGPYRQVSLYPSIQTLQDHTGTMPAADTPENLKRRAGHRIITSYPFSSSKSTTPPQRVPFSFQSWAKVWGAWVKTPGFHHQR